MLASGEYEWNGKIDLAVTQILSSLCIATDAFYLMFRCYVSRQGDAINKYTALHGIEINIQEIMNSFL